MVKQMRPTILNTEDHLFASLAGRPFAEVRAAYIALARLESGRRASVSAHMLQGGYEVVHGENTPDGREIIKVLGQTYALRPEIHAERLAAAFDAAKKAQPGTKSVVGTESLSAMVCPKCGDALQHTAVCPACAAGKLGYRHRYTCVCGGVDLISKDKL